jgi:hypothetical protein
MPSANRAQQEGNRLKIVIIGGPNGAGKTTFAREFLPNEADCPLFINASDCRGTIAVRSRGGRASRRAGDARRDRSQFRRAQELRVRDDAGGAHVCAAHSGVAGGGAAGMTNFLEIYRKLVTHWQWVDNSIKGGRLIEEGTNE